MTELEPEVLQVLVKKSAQNLRKLKVTGMKENGEQTVKMTIETNLVDFVCHASQFLEDLTIRQNEMSEVRG